MIQNLLVGIAFIAAGLAIAIVPPQRLPSWLQLETFARYRVPFALPAIPLGAFVVLAAVGASAS